MDYLLDYLIHCRSGLSTGLDSQGLVEWLRTIAGTGIDCCILQHQLQLQPLCYLNMAKWWDGVFEGGVLIRNSKFTYGQSPVDCGDLVLVLES